MSLDLRPALWMLVVSFAAGWSAFAAERSAVVSKAPTGLPPSGAGVSLRQREGSLLVDVPGCFKLTSDRATFYPAGSEQRYLGLENLNLERIALVVSENPDQLEWVVSGAITEYRGANYLLVSKALLKTKPDSHSRSDLPAAAPNRAAAR